MKLPILLLTVLFTTTVVTAQLQRHDHHDRILRDLLDDSDETPADLEGLEDQTTPGLVGDRCGRDHPCAGNLDCLRVPLLKRCYPVTCGVRAVQTLVDQTQFDLREYGQQLWQRADLDPVEATAEMFRQFPDRQLNLFHRNSTLLQRMMTTIREHRPPMELFTESFHNCTRGAFLDTAGNNSLARTSVAGMTTYFGGSLELGLLGTYNADMYYAQGMSKRMDIIDTNIDINIEWLLLAVGSRKCLCERGIICSKIHSMSYTTHSNNS